MTGSSDAMHKTACIEADPITPTAVEDEHGGNRLNLAAVQDSKELSGIIGIVTR